MKTPAFQPKHWLKGLKFKLLGTGPPAVPYSHVIWSDDDTLQYLRQTRILAQSIIQQVSQMTDVSQSPLLLPQIRTELRAPPSSMLSSIVLQKSSKNNLGEIITQLTLFDYGPRATEHISHYFYTLLKAGNKLPSDRLLFNTLIGYFLSTNDLHMSNLVLDRMVDHLIVPDRTTLHLLLKFHADRVQRNPYPVGVSGHPLIATQRCLHSMDKFGVRADTTTWNLVLQCMPFGFGKSFLVEEMDKRGIPLNSESRRVILQTIIDDRSENKNNNTSSDQSRDLPHQLIECLDPTDPVVVQMLIDYMLSRKSANNENILKAWKFLQNSTLSIEEKTSTAIFNTILKRFAARRHLDWQFGLISYFKNTKWDSKTWEYFLNAAALSKDQPAKYMIAGTLLKEMERNDIPMNSRMRILARQVLRKASSHKFELRDLGPQNFQLLKEGLQWINLFQPIKPELLAAIGYGPGEDCLLGSVPITELDESRFASMPTTNNPLRRKELAEFLHCI